TKPDVVKFFLHDLLKTRGAGYGHLVFFPPDVDEGNWGDHRGGARAECFGKCPFFETSDNLIKTDPAFFNAERRQVSRDRQNRIARNPVEDGARQLWCHKLSVQHEHDVHHPYLVDILVFLVISPKDLIESFGPSTLGGIKSTTIIARTLRKPGSNFSG